MTITLNKTETVDPFARLRSWEPRLRPIMYSVGEDSGEDLRRADGWGSVVVRDDSQQPIGVVGNRYHLVPNRDKIALFDMLAERGVINNLRCGEFGGGSKVWLQGQSTGRQIEIVPGHTLQHRMTICDGYDGSISMALVDTATNIVCQNTFALARKTGVGFRFRHTKSILAQFNNAVAAIKRSMEDYEYTAQRLRAASMMTATASDLTKMLDKFFPLPKVMPGDEGDGVEATQDKRNRIAWAYEAAPGAQPGTRYGLYQAMTYYLTHESGRDSHRRESNLVGSAMKTNREALAWILN